MKESVCPSECCKYQWLPGGSGGTEFGQEGEGILFRKQEMRHTLLIRPTGQSWGIYFVQSGRKVGKISLDSEKHRISDLKRS